MKKAIPQNKNSVMSCCHSSAVDYDHESLHVLGTTLHIRPMGMVDLLRHRVTF